MGKKDAILSDSAIGDADWEELRSTLRRLVGKLCPSLLRGQEEDLVQAALIRCMGIVKKSEGQTEFSTSYLWKVAHSAAMDAIRHRKRRPEVAMDAEDLPEVDAESTADPQRALEGGRFGAALDHCLVNLVESRRLAVTLYLQGHRMRQAAELLGWTNKKTENLVYRGLADLRECLRAKGITP